MDVDSVLAELRKAGSSTAAATYHKHGVTAPCLGVRFKDIDRLAKRHRGDNVLAEELWASGIHDARVLAARLADGARLPAKLIDGWVGDLSDHILTDEFVAMMADHPSAATRMRKWIDSPREWRSAAGWGLVGALASRGDVGEGLARELLDRIHDTIRTVPNRTRHTMILALICIGSYGDDALHRSAIACAERVWPVEIDHGATGCRTPEPISYMSNTRAHLAKSGKRRRHC